MTRNRAFVPALFALLVALLLAPGRELLGAADTLPTRLTDQEFWKLSGDLSEPNGSFRSDNLLSNELYYPQILSDLVSQTKPGGVYLGVGPEQNFEYIVAIRPKMAFITDIRRGNLHAQLMYKALFELSTDRADFVSRLFSKATPAGVTAKSSIADIMNAFWDAPSLPETEYTKNLQAIDDLLTKKHTLPLPKDDLDGIEYVYHNFYWFGPPINYNSSSQTQLGRGGNMTDYASLMVAADNGGIVRSFLASDETFRFMKDLEQRNMIVPVVGNFGGPKALRAVGKYVRDHGSVVEAFYLSNVEQYLRQDGIWDTFCANVASMPLDDNSTFIRSGQSGGFGGGGRGLMNSLGGMLAETRQSCPVAPGR